MDGVVRTRVGYAGGTKERPTYHSLGDHTEVVQVDFDPTQTTYGVLLSIFWQSHNPTTKPYGRQYMSLILTADDAQQRQAELSRDQIEAQRGKVFTEIKPLANFYLAEDYHQKYYLTRVPLLASELRAKLSFVDSLVVARINGFVAGFGTKVMLEHELAEFGLSEDSARKLRAVVASQD